MAARLPAGVVLAGLVLAQPLAGATLLTLRAGDRTLEVAPSGIADMDISESGGITDVFLRLMPRPAEALADLTDDRMGQRLALSVCGEVVMEAEIRGRNDSGTIYLAGTTMVRAEAMRALWHGRASCDTLAPEVFEHGQ
jgi:hypothetical protein